MIDIIMLFLMALFGCMTIVSVCSIIIYFVWSLVRKCIKLTKQTKSVQSTADKLPQRRDVNKMRIGNLNIEV